MPIPEPFPRYISDRLRGSRYRDSRQRACHARAQDRPLRFSAREELCGERRLAVEHWRPPGKSLYIVFRGGEWSPLSEDRRWRRSEEHTSELQSLMRISYAVFCLKKKKNLSDILYNNNHLDIID